MLGIAKLNTLDLSAANEFNKYLFLYKGKSFMKAGWQKLAWIALINNDTLSYRKNLKNILSAGNDFTDEDKQALKETENNELPNVLLLKSRLLFDGGNFKQALTVLAGKGMENFPTLKNKLELTYRLGRIYDRLGMIKNAIGLYEKTIQNGSKFSYYFAANSCLHLAQLYENTNDKVNAEKYYKTCLSLRNHEYQNSIDQKAKAGLNRLGKNTAEAE
jgi:tetratricopeptide (TPR) repeat protein